MEARSIPVKEKTWLRVARQPSTAGADNLRSQLSRQKEIPEVHEGLERKRILHSGQHRITTLQDEIHPKGGSGVGNKLALGTSNKQNASTSWYLQNYGEPWILQQTFTSPIHEVASTTEQAVTSRSSASEEERTTLVLLRLS